MLYVDEIKNGTVIDHINVGKGKKVLEILDIGNNDKYRVALLVNVNSKSKGSKDILKIDGIYLSDDQVNQIALVSPSATINRIKNKKVISKHKVELPAKLNIIGKCPNISCITNYESASETSFDLEHKEYRCIYCERTFKPFELIK